jgi:hypothetical protein
MRGLAAVAGHYRLLCIRLIVLEAVLLEGNAMTAEWRWGTVTEVRSTSLQPSSRIAAWTAAARTTYRWVPSGPQELCLPHEVSQPAAVSFGSCSASVVLTT